MCINTFDPYNNTMRQLPVLSHFTKWAQRSLKTYNHTARIWLSEFEFRQNSSRNCPQSLHYRKILCYRLRNKTSSLSTYRFKSLLIHGDLQERAQPFVKFFSCWIGDLSQPHFTHRFKNIWKNIVGKGLECGIFKKPQINNKNTNNPIKKWANYLNRLFTKEDAQMANKHQKRFSTLYVIREMKTKIPQ